MICFFVSLVVGLTLVSSVLARPEVSFSFESGKVYMFWDSFPSTGFSLALNDYAFSNPDSLVSSYNNYYVFKNVSPGLHYVHMKYGKGEYWSEPEHWEIIVPEVLGASTQKRCFWFFCW